MRQIIVTTFVSLDGVMDSPGGGEHPHAGWSFKDVEFDEAAYALKAREQEESSAMLIGRVSYEEFAPVWPSMTAEFPRYNAMPKYVVSSTLSPSTVADGPWANCHLLRTLDDVAALKAAEPAGDFGDGPITVHGSARLAQSLAAAGLVDRYHLLTFPTLLGANGKRLFAADGAHQRLELVDHATYGNGVQMSVLDVVR